MKKTPLMQRLRAKNEARAGVVGVTWYATEDAWFKVKTNALDSELFEESFDEWQTMAAEAFTEIESKGLKLVKVCMVPEEFMHWCAERSKENNAASRAEFAADQLRNSATSKVG